MRLWIKGTRTDTYSCASSLISYTGIKNKDRKRKREMIQYYNPMDELRSQMPQQETPDISCNLDSSLLIVVEEISVEEKLDAIFEKYDGHSLRITEMKRPENVNYEQVYHDIKMIVKGDK
jgi:hypothetical protein